MVLKSLLQNNNMVVSLVIEKLKDDDTNRFKAQLQNAFGQKLGSSVKFGKQGVKYFIDNGDVILRDKYQKKNEEKYDLKLKQGNVWNPLVLTYEILNGNNPYLETAIQNYCRKYL